jgi:hypothetical protein
MQDELRMAKLSTYRGKIYYPFILTFCIPKLPHSVFFCFNSVINCTLLKFVFAVSCIDRT